MNCYDELVARGLIAQVTNEEEIKKMVNEGKAVFYIGFDPTADSLHVGHFMQLIIMRYMQQAGHRPIVLLGGGTTMVGDPTGKTDMRKMLTQEQIQHNADEFKKQMSKFIDFSEGKAIMANNADWLLGLNYVDFLIIPFFTKLLQNNMVFLQKNIKTEFLKCSNEKAPGWGKNLIFPAGGFLLVLLYSFPITVSSTALLSLLQIQVFQGVRTYFSYSSQLPAD